MFHRETGRFYYNQVFRVYKTVPPLHQNESRGGGTLGLSVHPEGVVFKSRP